MAETDSQQPNRILAPPIQTASVESLINREVMFPALSDEPFLARENELKQLINSITSVSLGGLSRCIIYGEPGSGKTNLWHEAVKRIQQDGKNFRVVVLEGDNAEEVLSFAPLREWFYPIKQQLSIRLEPIARAILETLVIGGIDNIPDIRAEIPAEHFQVELARLFWRVLHDPEYPTLLIVDNLNWFDPASLKLIYTMLRTPLPNGMAVVLTQRDTEEPESPSEISELLADSSRRPKHSEIFLRPLNIREIQRFRETFSRSDLSLRTLARSTNGNPAYLVLLLSQSTDVSISQALTERLLKLSRPSRELLELLCVLGKIRRFAELTRILRITAEQGLDLLDELVERARLLKPFRKDGYRLARDLVGNHVREKMGNNARAKWSLRVAQAMESDDIGFAAIHYEKAITILGHTELEAAARVFIEVGYSQAMKGDLSGGHRWLELVHSGEFSYRDKARALVRLAHSLESNYQTDKADKALQEADSLSDRLDPLTKALVWNSQSLQAYNLRGDTRKSWALAKKAYRALEKLPDRKSNDYIEQCAFALSNFGLVLYAWGRYRLSERLHLKALELREELGRRDLIARSQNNLGLALTALNSGKAAEYLKKSRKILRDIGHFTYLARSFNNLGKLIDRSDRAMALRYYRRAERIAASFGERYVSGAIYNNLGTGYFETDPEKALNYYNLALGARDFVVNPLKQATVLGNLIEVEIWLGKYQAAKQHLEQYLDLDKQLDSPSIAALPYFYLGDLRMIEGNVEEAMAAYDHSAMLAAKANLVDQHAHAISRFARLKQDIPLANDALKLHDSPITQASLLFAKGEYSQAIEIMKSSNTYEQGQLFLQLVLVAPIVAEKEEILKKASELLYLDQSILQKSMLEIGKKSAASPSGPSEQISNNTRDLILRANLESTLSKGGPVSLEVHRWNPSKSQEPNNVLFLPSDASNERHLKLLRELGKVRQQIREANYRDKFNLESEELVTPEGAARAIRDFDPTILHFAGHGASNGKLVWLNETGSSFMMAVEALATLISARRHQIQCVVLNACFTNTEAEVLLKHVPFVIATTAAITDDAAIAFATGFYQALAGGDDLGEAFNAGLAQIKTQLPQLNEHQKLVLLERRP